MTETIGPAGGLRERKKARTRVTIREHALRLFREQGYHATTVEQIAAAAEVSPSTFFRYFPTKEDVVLQDDMDIRLVESLARQPSDRTPIAAVRGRAAGSLGVVHPGRVGGDPRRGAAVGRGAGDPGPVDERAGPDHERAQRGAGPPGRA